MTKKRSYLVTVEVVDHDADMLDEIIPGAIRHRFGPPWNGGVKGCTVVALDGLHGRQLTIEETNLLACLLMDSVDNIARYLIEGMFENVNDANAARSQITEMRSILTKIGYENWYDHKYGPKGRL